VLLASGCGHKSASREVHEAGADRKVHIDLGDGPLDELTILRGSDGRFVVAGVCLFPEDTRLEISVTDSTGGSVGNATVVVQHALIQTSPVGAPGAPGRPALYRVRVSATFVPGLQSEPVMQAIGDGKRYHGEGMTKTLQGRLAYDRIFQVRM